jgi:hypothetical protein
MVAELRGVDGRAVAEHANQVFEALAEGVRLVLAETETRRQMRSNAADNSCSGRTKEGL